MSLEGFRGIKECEKLLKLSKFTLLIGANNSGKSAVLEALALLWFPYNDLPILETSIWHVIDEIHGPMSSLIYRYSGHGSVRYVLRSTLRKAFVNFINEVGDKGHIKLSTDQEPNMTGEEYAEKAFLGTHHGPTDEVRKQLQRYIAFIPQNDAFRDRLIKSLYNEWDLVEKTGAPVKVVRNVIAKVVQDRLTEATLKKDDIVFRKEFSDGDSAYIRLQDKGDGIRMFLPAALYLEALNPKVVLWDDLETSAHPSMISAIIRWLAEHDWQVIASTHSLDLLREFVSLGPEEGKVLTLRKSADDVLTYKELSIDELEQLFEAGQDVRKLMEWR